MKELKTSLVVQWLRFHIPNAGDVGSIPSWKTKSSHAIQHGQKIKRKKKKKLILGGGTKWAELS